MDEKEVRQTPLTHEEVRLKALELAIERHRELDKGKTFPARDSDITRTAKEFEKFLFNQ